MSRWTCPTCGTSIELHITPRRPPTCRHVGTRHDAKRMSEMKEEVGE